MCSMQVFCKVFSCSCIFIVLVFAFAACGGDSGDSSVSSGGSNGSQQSAGAATMVRINSGTFQMGSPSTEPNRYVNETNHQVTLTKGFYMGKYPVTQELYQTVMATNPSFFLVNNPAGEVQAKRPVDSVSWYDAIVFCNKLSVREGLTPVYSISGSTNTTAWGDVPTIGNSYANKATWDAAAANWDANGYRLPTEAEWEYACRANTTTAYNNGASISTSTGWYASNSDEMTHEVGKKPANDWGLYDMHGNVFEWCWDWYGAYATASVSDPKGPPDTGLFGRVARGGSWHDNAKDLRSAYRGSSEPGIRDWVFGIRVVRLAQ